MEVVRWLAKEPRPNLRRAKFTVRHNLAAAFEMAVRLQGLGLQVETRPFGIELPEAEPLPGRPALPCSVSEPRALLRRLRGLEPLPQAGAVHRRHPGRPPVSGSRSAAVPRPAGGSMVITLEGRKGWPRPRPRST